MGDVLSVENVIADDELKKYLKELVIERISVMPAGMKIAIGDEEFASDEIAERVESEDEIRIQMMEMELEYLRALSSGGIYT